MRSFSVCAVLLCALTANAQTTLPENFSVERMRITGARSGIIDTEWAALPDGFAWDVGLWAGYSKNPLVLYNLSDGKRVGSLLSDRLGIAISGAVSFNERIGVGLEIPMIALNNRAEMISGVTTDSLRNISGFAIGDIKVAPKVGLLMWKQQAVDLALMATVTIPSGQATKYAGDSLLTVMPELLVSRPFGNLRAALNLGFNVRPVPVAFLNQNVDSEFQGRLGLSYKFNQEDTSALPLEIGASILGGTSLITPFKNANQNPVEAKLMASYDIIAGLQIFAGGGVGISHGWGVPDWRVMGGLRYGTWGAAAKPADEDTDGDGIPDSADKCPTQAEDKDGFTDSDGCPDPDNDFDGVPDVQDKCPNVSGVAENAGCPPEKPKDSDGDGIVDPKDNCPSVAEDMDKFEDDDGCPEIDNDKDGILDGVDACPDKAGPMENRGCPDTDGDGDGVIDRLDNCPKEPGTAKNAGCKEKQLAVISVGKIVIYEAVYFQTNKAVIEARSFKLLDNIANILKEHPEIEKMRIEGHTDNVGDPAKNQALSQDRAAAVKSYLVRKAISTKRLEAVGYGQEKPIAENKTAAGKAKNRRVEFNIVAPGEKK